MPFRRSAKKFTQESELYEYAVGALARRMRTVAEMKRLLRNRVAPGEAGTALVEAVVARLKEQKYLNDASYAASYSALRRDNEKLGRQRVVTDLKARGVHGEVIDKAVSEAYGGVREEKLAREFLTRRRMRRPTTDKEAAKVFRALVRAGFRSGTVVALLKKWKVDEEMLTRLEEEATEL